MGYSDNPALVEAMRPALKLLEEGQPCAWSFDDPGDLRRWAYRVREALHIARRHAPLFPELAQAADRFVITIDKDAGKVLATFAEVRNEAMAANRTPRLDLREPVALAVSNNTVDSFVTIPGKQSVFDIINAWQKRQPAFRGRLSFPDAALPATDVARLAAWAATRKPHGGQFGWLVIHNEDAITLLPYDPDLADVAVQPAVLPSEATANREDSDV